MNECACLQEGSLCHGGTLPTWALLARSAKPIFKGRPAASPRVLSPARPRVPDRGRYRSHAADFGSGLVPSYSASKGASSPLLHHRLGHKLGKQEAGVEVRLDHLIPVLGCLFEDTPKLGISALLIKMLMDPSVSSTFSRADCSCPRAVTSTLIAKVGTPRAWSSLRTRWFFSSFRARTATAAPA